jgi:hypothetical protein
MVELCLLLKIRRAYPVLANRSLSMKHHGDEVKFVVSKFSCHCALVLEY